MKLLLILLPFVLLGGVRGFVPPHSSLRRFDVAMMASSFKQLPIPPPPTSASLQSDDFVQAIMDQVTNVLTDLNSKIPTLDNIQPVDNILDSLQPQLDALQQQLAAINDAPVLQELNNILSTLIERLLETVPQARPYYESLGASIPPSMLVGASVLLLVTLAASSSSSSSSSVQQSPYPDSRYNPETAAAYFAQRPFQVVTRGISILLQSLQFTVRLLSDKVNNRLAENEAQRGRELATLLTRLGPTFIKVGQSLSIRTDLLSPGYIRGLETLQDQVPAFDTAVATRILEQEWGRPVREVLVSDLTAEPVAAASLGQVYKGTLRDTNQDVAIKIQRPDITEQIALDMHLLRTVATIVKGLGQLNSDTTGTVDAWGTGFVDELDYLQEGRNAAFFSERIQETPLKDVVFAPTVVEEYSTRSVLVTEWVDGERLDQSSSEDVTVLCSIAMNTYLTMLLELGLLHCDPHPGNLLRTREDGRLCILDWGMVTRLDKDLQLTLIEHMAHLTSADYAEIPRDLLLLGFIPEEKKDLIEDSGVVEVLASIYGAWTKGGGAAAINVNDVIVSLQNLTAEKGNLFQIPPYFAYIAKSFSVLEGIGLSNNPKYSIINECLPYVSKRLLTDKENLGPALSTFIFGPEKTSKDRVVDYDRVEQLMEGFGNYATSVSGALLGKEELSRREVLEQSADQILDLVFTTEETPLQQIMLEQLAKIVSASGRLVFTNLRERSGTLPSGRTVLGTMVDPLGLWRTSPLVRLNELDEKTIDTTRKLLILVQRQLQETNNPAFDLSNLTTQESTELVSILVRKIWSRRSGVLQTSNRFARTLLQLTAEKLEQGERDTRILPPTPPEREGRYAPRGALPQAVENRESNRLKQARQLLEGLKDTSMAEAVPVKTRFD